MSSSQQPTSKSKNLGGIFKFKNGSFKLSSLNYNKNNNINNNNNNNNEGSVDEDFAHIPEEEEVDASEFEDDNEFQEKKIPNARKPKDTPFLQQRLSSYNPIFTPKLTLSVYIFLTFIFVLFGGILISVSRKTDEIIIFYEHCSSSAPQSDFGKIPSDFVKFHFHKANRTFDLETEWKYTPLPSSDSYMGSENGTCSLRFTTPYDLPHPIYVSYLVENFYPNHRRYALSFNEDQITGMNTTISDIKDSTGISCKVLHTDEETGKQLYPCGLIANAMFNDTFGMSLVNSNDNSKDYELTNKGITWSTNKNRFKKTKLSYDQIAPPPYWQKSYPEGYNSTNVPDISTWEEFQNWMDNPALPRFSKLVRKSSSSSKNLNADTYEIDIELNWPVTMYKGKKAFFLTHGSSVGSYNNFLGTAYLIGGILCLAVAALILFVKLVSGRKTADPSLLSWYKKNN